jgi:ADP-ribose pyrophosphatase YjhB (NUDIX family)
MTPSFPCARCGRPVTRRAPTRTRPKHIECPRCRYVIYDYPRPAAGVLVVKDDSVLLLRRGHRPRIGFLDVPGGFMEAGESIEGAARRELREETGIVMGALEPLGFYWDTYSLKGFGRFPTMNWYFVGRWRRGEPVAADDAASADWIPLAKLASMRPRYSWRHMPELFGDLRAWVKLNAKPRRAPARAGR